MLADVRASVYTRISQDRVGLAAGVTRQREACDARCRDRGWAIASHHEDNDITASGRKKRAGFEAMLADIAKGEVGAVVAWSLDRLQRNRRDELRLYELCRDRGVIISLVNGAELDFGSATGRLVADNLGSLARFEIELKSDRQLAASRQAALAGRRVGGRRPFGYEADGVTVRLHEAAAVRDGFRAVLAGVPLGEIARDWNRRGFTTGQARRKGEHAGEPSPWRRYSVRMVLRNPRYAGLRSLRGEIVAAAEWPPLVDEGTFHAVRAVLDDPGRRDNPSRGVALLTGIGLCGVCGAAVHAGGATGGIRGYRCSGSTGHVARRAEPVEQYVSAVIVERLSRPDAAELLIDRALPDLDALRTESAALRSRLDSLAVDFADGELTASQLRAATDRLRGRLGEIENEMADAARVDVLGPVVTARDLRAAWGGLGVARQRAVVDMLAMVTVMPAGRGTRTFRPESVAIEWRVERD
jgi:site-specific DNA recombinase